MVLLNRTWNQAITHKFTTKSLAKTSQSRSAVSKDEDGKLLTDSDNEEVNRILKLQAVMMKWTEYWSWQTVIISWKGQTVYWYCVIIIFTLHFFVCVWNEILSKIIIARHCLGLQRESWCDNINNWTNMTMPDLLAAIERSVWEGCPLLQHYWPLDDLWVIEVSESVNNVITLTELHSTL